MKRLFSLLLLVSSFAWSSLLHSSNYEGQAGSSLPRGVVQASQDGVVESKGTGVGTVFLQELTEPRALAADEIAVRFGDDSPILVMHRAGLKDVQLLLDESAILAEEDSSGGLGAEGSVINLHGLAPGSAALLKLFLRYWVGEVGAQAEVAALSGRELVDQLALASHLAVPLDDRRLAELVGFLKNKLSLEVVEYAVKKLKNFPGFPEEKLKSAPIMQVAGVDAGFSPDDSLMWVTNVVQGQKQVQFYRWQSGAWAAVGAAVPGDRADFVPNSNLAWVTKTIRPEYKEVRLCYLEGLDLEVGLVAVNARIGFAKDGSLIWILNNGFVQFYYQDNSAWGALGKEVPATDAGCNLDANMVWIANSSKKIQFYDYDSAGRTLKPFGTEVDGVQAGFSRDSKLIWARSEYLQPTIDYGMGGRRGGYIGSLMQAYHRNGESWTKVGAIRGMIVRFGPDSSLVWTANDKLADFADQGYEDQFYQLMDTGWSKVGATRLSLMYGSEIPKFSPDGRWAWDIRDGRLAWDIRDGRWAWDIRGRYVSFYYLKDGIWYSRPRDERSDLVEHGTFKMASNGGLMAVNRLGNEWSLFSWIDNNWQDVGKIPAVGKFGSSFNFSSNGSMVSVLEGEKISIFETITLLKGLVESGRELTLVQQLVFRYLLLEKIKSHQLFHLSSHPEIKKIYDTLGYKPKNFLSNFGAV